MQVVSEAFMAACEAARRDSGATLKGRVTDVKRGGWLVVINGTDAPVAVEREGCMGVDALPPRHLAAFWNGWLAGILNPAGGALAAGEAANEDAFIAAMREAGDAASE